MIRPPPRSTLFPYTPLSLSAADAPGAVRRAHAEPTPATVPPRAEQEPERAAAPAEAGVLPRGQLVRGRGDQRDARDPPARPLPDRKSTRLNSSHANISYAVF